MHQVAAQKAKYLVKKLNLIARDKQSPEPFRFENAGSLAYIGNWCVAADEKLYSWADVLTGKRFTTRAVTKTVCCPIRRAGGLPGCSGGLHISP